jgi:heme oxygenase
MPRQGALALRLDEEMREHHTAVDEPWLYLMRPSAVLADYAAQLRRTLGFEAPIEAAWRRTPNLGNYIDLDRRYRSQLLVRDLCALAQGSATFAQLPEDFTLQEALGWMYVVERSGLLRATMRRRLVAQFHEAANACAYLDACEAGERTQWTELANALDAAADSPDAAEAIVGAADAGFRALRHWIATTRPSQITNVRISRIPAPEDDTRPID